MGRDLNFYVIPDVIQHETDKPLCLNLESSTENIVYDLLDLYEGTIENRLFPIHLLPTDVQKIDINNLEEWKFLMDKNHEQLWCSKCLMYKKSDLSLKYVIAKYNIGHSYSSPIWMSDWSIYKMYFPTKNTSFTRSFGPDSDYEEVNKDSIDYIEDKIIRLNKEPQHFADVEAYEETNELVDFCRKWLDDDKVRIIYQREI